MTAAQLDEELLKAQSGHNLVLIDDDAENSTFLAHIFESSGFTVYCADTCSAGITLMVNNHVDAVILDIELSRKERSELMNALQSIETGAPPLLALTSPSTMSREEAYDWGAADVLSKPIDPKAIVRRVRELLVPTELRWTAASSRISNTRRIQTSLDKTGFGRGGFSVLVSSENAIEGEGVEFEIELKDYSEPLRGQGIIRYVTFDHKLGHQNSWGVELMHLESRSTPLFDSIKRLTSSYIPKSIH